MKIICILTSLFLLTSAQAQFLDRLAISTEYRYLGRHVGGLGFEYRLPQKDALTFNVGAKAFYTDIEGKGKVLPQFNIEYGLFLEGGVSVTPYAIEPQLQINALNVITLNTGYAIPIHPQKYFKGITFGAQINIAVRKDSKYYERLKIGF